MIGECVVALRVVTSFSKQRAIQIQAAGSEAAPTDVANRITAASSLLPTEPAGAGKGRLVRPRAPAPTAIKRHKLAADALPPKRDSPKIRWWLAWQ